MTLDNRLLTRVRISPAKGGAPDSHPRNQSIDFLTAEAKLQLAAAVVKLVDTHGSGPCGRKPVRVRLSPAALIL